MKKMNYAKLLYSAGLLTGSALAGADVIDTTFDYATNPANGQWVYWSKPGSPAVCGVGTPTWDSVNQQYFIDIELTDSCRYVYYRMNFPHALDGTTALHADVKIEATSGLLSDASASLGYGVDYPGFGANGRVVNNITYNIAAGDWQTIGGDYTPFLQNAKSNLQKTFALSETGDFLAKSVGPVIFLYNKTVPSDLNNTTMVRRPVTLRVTIDNVRVQHDGSALDSSYLSAATTAANAYFTRVDPDFDSLHADIVSQKTAIDSLSLSAHPALAAQLSAEANAIKAAHDANVAAAAARTDASMKVPTQVQYDQDVAGLEALGGLLNLGDYVVNNGQGLIYYPWEAVGRKKLNDVSLSVSAAPLEPSFTTLAINEIEPVSVVLQNLNDQDISVSQVAPGTLTNQFGEVFPSGKIDVRVVKNWYTGSAVSIGVGTGDAKVRVPELLLKDDELVHVDTATKSNSLRIESQSSQFYQDISSPTAQMPNDATVEDATTLQPFTVDALHAKQLWLTVDTRSDVRPGYYSGNVVVSYQIVGDSTPRTLQVPVELNVLPVNLLSSNLLYGIYYRAKIDPTKAGLNSEYKTETQYLAELTNMLEHGVDHPTQYLGSSLSAVANYVTLREGLGLPCDKYFFLDGIGGVGTSTSTATTNATNLIGVLQSYSSCPNAQLYMYGQDEATGTALDNELDAMQAVHTAGGKTFVAGYVGTYSHIHAGLDTLVFSGKPNDTEIALWRNDGKDVYSYGNPQIGVPDPYVYRANYGFLLWQHDYTGAMDYAYQHGFPGKSPAHDLAGCSISTTGYCSLWNDFDSSQYYDHVFTYPTTTGVVDTIQWEGFREAVDDTRYLATLESVMQQSDDPTTVDDVESMLDIIKGMVDLDPAVGRYYLQVALSTLNKAPSIGSVQLFTGADAVLAVGEASDPEGYVGNIEVKLDGGGWQSVGNESPWQFEFHGVSDGAHTVHYRVTDYWGSTDEGEGEIEVDTQSPGC